MNKPTLIASGLLAAGLGPCLVWGITILMGHDPSHTTLALFVLFSLITYCFAAAFALIFGLPLFLLLNHFRLVRWWSAAWCGLTVGVVVAFVFALPHAPLAANVRNFALYGMASSLLFWVVWRSGAHA